jgi:hypothetical protein
MQSKWRLFYREFETLEEGLLWLRVNTQFVRDTLYTAYHGKAHVPVELNDTVRFSVDGIGYFG